MTWRFAYCIYHNLVLYRHISYIKFKKSGLLNMIRKYSWDILRYHEGRLQFCPFWPAKIRKLGFSRARAIQVPWQCDGNNIPNNIIPSHQTGARTQYRCLRESFLVIEEILNEHFGIARNSIVPGSLEETGFGRSTRSSIAASGVPHLWPKPEGGRMLVPDDAEQ